MTHTVSVRNHQRGRRVNTGLLGAIAESILTDVLRLDGFLLEVSLLSCAAMERVNRLYLGHGGATDVIAFDYTEGAGDAGLHGEILICTEVAESQSGRYRTTWQEELARYLVHGILHLRGYDDCSAPARKRMKAREARVLGWVRRRFALSGLGPATTLRR